jgi:hypothetical protein
VAFELAIVVTVVPFDGRVLDGSAHPLDLAVRRGNGPPDHFLILLTPGVLHLGQAALDAVLAAAHVDMWVT